MSLSIFNDIPLSPFFAVLSVSQLSMFFFEIFSTICIYDKLKNVSEESATIIHSIPIVKPNGRLSSDVGI